MHRENVRRESDKNALCCFEKSPGSNPGKKKQKKKQLYSQKSPITKNIQVREIRHLEDFWTCRDELISDVLTWTFARRYAKVGRPSQNYQDTSALSGHWMQSRESSMSDGW